MSLLRWLVILGLPCLAFFPGLADGVPNAARLERVVPDEVARWEVARLIQEDRLKFQEILSQGGYTNYEAYKQELRTERTYRITDGAGRSYELTRSHVNYLKRVIFGSSFGDETKTVTALNMIKTTRGNPHWFLYGGSYLYVCALFLGAGWAVGYLVPGDVASLVMNADQITRLFLLIKLVNLPAFIVSTWLVGRLARRLIADRPGVELIAAALFAVTPVYTSFLHVAKPYIISQAYVLAALWFLLQWCDDRRRLSLAAAGVFWGLAVGSNYFFVVYVIPFLVIYAHRGRGTGSAVHEMAGAARVFAWLSLIGAMTFFVVNPFWLPSFREVMHELFVQTGPKRMGHGPWANFLYFFVRPVFTIGLPATVLSYAFLVGAVRRRTLLGMMALVTVLVFGVALSLLWNMKPQAIAGLEDLPINEHYDGFTVHLWLLLLVVQGFVSVHVRRPLLAAALCSLVLLSNVASSGYVIARIAHYEEDYTAAGRWIEQHVPRGESIQPLACFDEPVTREERRGLTAQMLMPFFSLLDYRVEYPPYALEDVDSFAMHVVLRDRLAESDPAFQEQFERVYASRQGHPVLNVLFHRYGVDLQPILIYRRVATARP